MARDKSSVSKLGRSPEPIRIATETLANHQRLRVISRVPLTIVPVDELRAARKPLVRSLFYGYSTFHSGFEVTRNEAGKIDAASFTELPDNLAVGIRVQRQHI